MGIISDFYRVLTHRQSYRLYLKQFIISFTAILIPLLLISFFFIFNTYRVAIEEMEELIDSNLKRVSDIIDTVFKETDFLSAGVAIHGNTRTFLLSSKKELEQNPELGYEIIDYLRPFVDQRNYISSIYIFSERNNFVLARRGWIEVGLFSDNAWIEPYRDYTGIRPFTSVREYADKDVLSVIKPVRRLELEVPLGAIIINLDNFEFENLLSGSNDVDDIYIFDNMDNTVLYSTNVDSVGKNIASLFDEIKIITQSGYHNVRREGYLYTVREGRNRLSYLFRLSLQRIESRQQNILSISFLFVVIAIPFSFLLSVLISWYSYRPLFHFLQLFDYKKAADTRNEEEYISQNIVRMIESNRSLNNELNKKLTILNQTKISLLHNQINPHFLNNTLESIRWEAVSLTKGENKASRMVEVLANLLRLGLETTKEIVPLQKEILHAELYARLLTERFPETLRFQTEISRAHLNHPVLNLSLQPLIENAYIHGLKPQEAKGTIRVHSRVKHGILYLSVSDDGAGISKDRLEQLQGILAQEEDKLPQEHIGLLNLAQRLKLVFGEQASVSLQPNESGGLTVTLITPLS
jgi:two-component system, sensor histidine kinase YesM